MITRTAIRWVVLAACLLGFAAILMGAVMSWSTGELANWSRPLAGTESIVEPLDNRSSEAIALAAVPSPTPVSLIFVGDMMFDRHIRLNSAKLGGYVNLLSPQLQQQLAKADLVVGNLEGPVTDSPSRSVGSAVGSTNNYIFTFDPAALAALKRWNITLVSLGNNHILNYGQDGLAQTYQHLRIAGIDAFGFTGQPISQTASGSVEPSWKVVTVRDQPMAFVNYNQFLPGGLDQALADLKAVTDTGYPVVVYAHWGNEYVPENAELKQLARRFVAAGADLIIGSHPHVITGDEVINGVPVHYSLGNFIFDQYFEPAVRQGLVVTAILDPVTQQFTTATNFVELKPNGQTVLDRTASSSVDH